MDTSFKLFVSALLLLFFVCIVGMATVGNADIQKVCRIAAMTIVTVMVVTGIVGIWTRL